MEAEVKFKFEKLRIWNIAMDLAEEVNELTEDFPKKELYNLSSQMRRAADSIALNISEGAILQTVPEYRKFIGYGIRSLAELVTCFHKAYRRKYLSTNDFNKFYGLSFSLMNMMVSFRSKIK